jgi:hypothetical protein
VTDLAFSPTISLRVNRCHECGAYWALEYGRRNSGSCPCCAETRVSRVLDEQGRLERCLRSQRAATSRATKGGLRVR